MDNSYIVLLSNFPFSLGYLIYVFVVVGWLDHIALQWLLNTKVVLFCFFLRSENNQQQITDGHFWIMKKNTLKLQHF